MRELGRITRITVWIYKIWILMPDLRFTQLLHNFWAFCKLDTSELYNLEDDVLEDKLEAFCEHLYEKCS